MRSTLTRVPLLLAALFAFRLLFGLCSEFFTEDETQIYLLGLRYHATGHWPFFGPDVVWTQSEIPGALPALAWYTCEQLPRAPRWLIWGWFLTVPSTLQFSTHVTNPSYVLPAAIVFFLGFFETVPAFSLRRLSPPVAHAFMGAAVTWVMQIHM